MALLAFNDVHALYGRARILNGVTFAVDADPANRLFRADLARAQAR